MISISIEPVLRPLDKHGEEFDIIRQTVQAYTITRNKYMTVFLKKEGAGEPGALPAAVERGLMQQFNKDPKVLEMDKEVNKLLDRTDRISIQPFLSLKIPVVGHDPIATQFIQNKYTVMQEKLEGVTEQVRAFWSTPFGEFFERSIGTNLLELSTAPHAIPALMGPAFENKDNPLALSLNHLLQVVPTLGSIFPSKRKRALWADELNILKMEVLQHYPSLQDARRIVEYIDYWHGRGHDFHVLLEDKNEENN